MADAPVTTQSSSPVNFAIGTFVVMKAVEFAGEYIKNTTQAHVAKHAHLLTKKRVLIFGGIAVGVGAWLYYKHKKAQLIAAQAAAAAVQHTAPAQISAEEVIASAMPKFDVSIW